MAVVLKPFPFAGDGFTVEDLKPGDDRDFGSNIAGLIAEGFVSDDEVPAVADVPPVVEYPVVEPVVAPTPVSARPKGRRGG